VVQVEARGVGPLQYRIVGRAAFPRLDNSDIEALADGATFTGDGLARVYDDQNSTRYLVGRLQPGVDNAATMRAIAAIPAFNRRETNFTTDTGAGGPSPPPEVERLRRVDGFPPSLAALLAVLAVIAVGHALVTSVSRRRRELAVLKSVGFSRRQVRATIAWQATTLALIGVVVGVPAGFAVGRWAWDRVADSLGIAARTPVPVAALVLIAIGSLVATNLVAFIPARSAARVRPALALRSE
jgi:hypothetical protein